MYIGIYQSWTCFINIWFKKCSLTLSVEFLYHFKRSDLLRLSVNSKTRTALTFFLKNQNLM